MSFFSDLVDAIYSLFGYRKVTMVSVLKTAGGAPVASEPVSFSYSPSGAANWVQDGTATTAADGTATGTVHLRSGTFDFRAVFGGANGFMTSQAEKDGVFV